MLIINNTFKFSLFLFVHILINLVDPSTIILDGKLLDGCYSSKFLRSSARRFLLEMLVRGTKLYDISKSDKTFVR